MAGRRALGMAAALAMAAVLLLSQRGVRGVRSAAAGNDLDGASRPRAVLVGSRQDFAAVSQGVLLEASFRVRNAGSRRLVLSRQSGACCGQSADQVETIVLPGEEVELVVPLDTSRGCGRIREVIRYSTNDPYMPQFALLVTAEVIPAAMDGQEGKATCLAAAGTAAPRENRADVPSAAKRMLRYYPEDHLPAEGADPDSRELISSFP